MALDLDVRVTKKAEKVSSRVIILLLAVTTRTLARRGRIMTAKVTDATKATENLIFARP